ncbi:nudix hydrolase 15 mitochondrial [Phtheirospermum japonicum]|uniref:Nudix hydrolase 15 mitochondrial n=1 Tax=Phtheirospermum japonicum TaxID=374723 RepID=A0A830B5A1_9LAMI|nr:nudix hydrolase 15 mitochondrial [Phtheirospermum japonicum]
MLGNFTILKITMRINTIFMIIIDTTIVRVSIASHFIRFRTKKRVWPKMIGHVYIICSYNILHNFIMTRALAYSRSIKESLNLISDGVDSAGGSPSILEWRLSESTITCEPIYGFLPCSTNVWGLLFLIVVYEILLSIGGQYVANGSNLFFQIIGPGVFGASLFQFLGTIPQIVLVLVSSLSGSTAAAQQRATLGMGLVAGTTVMLLTLIWGSSVILGSYDLSQSITAADNSASTVKAGYGVTTDVETSYTARIILVTLVPFLILQLEKVFRSQSGRRVVILIALIFTVFLMFAYIFYQIFRPWIQTRRFDYLMNKLYNKINKNNDTSVSAVELRVLLLGVKMDDNDLSTERDIENIMSSFDTSGDGRINQDEFIKGMTKLVSDLANQSTSQAQQASSTSTSQTVSNSWLNYFRAGFFVIVGTVMLCALAEPLIRTVVDFSQAANLSSFSVSYLAIPFAMNYGVAVQSIASARQKTQKSISLTLSALYGGVYMNNIIGLIVFLAPVYARNLTSDVSAEVLVVLLICIVMTIFISFRTTFPRWTGYLVLLLYPISLATVYVLTSVFGWS